MRTITELTPKELEQRIKELAKPGMVFGEPFRDGDTTIITASQVNSRPGRLVARPVGAILISPKGVELRRFRHPAEAVFILAMIAAIVFWLAMLLNPPWKPDANLVSQVRDLIKTIREEAIGEPPTS